jgi:low affinity Fe/Cu permease
VNDLFRRFARKAAEYAGSAWAFFAAVAFIVAWLATGPLFHFSDTWQLVINTATTIVTFLMVFLIQNSQNRDAKAIQLKLDELIRAVRSARNSMLDLEELTDEELSRLEEQFRRLRAEALERRANPKLMLRRSTPSKEPP